METGAKSLTWAGRVMSALPILFLSADGIAKLIKPVQVVEATVKLGYPESVIFGLGVVLLICTIIYAIPRTSVLGAILLTGYLGGATATHVRVGDSLEKIAKRFNISVKTLKSSNKLTGPIIKAGSRLVITN